MAKPKLRFPEFTEEWEEKQFCNIATISGGYAFDSKKMTSTPAKYQIVKMGNLYQGNLDLHRTPSFIENVTEKELEFLIQANDIGITLTGTVNKQDYGYSYRFGNEKNLLLNQRLGLIRAKQSVNAAFLSSIVKGKNFLTQFYNISTGGTGNQTNVSTKGIEKIMVSIPILKEQQKIADFLSSIDDVIQIQEEKIVALEEQKKGMMQKLFNREVRFKADDGSEYPEWKKKFIRECCIYSSSAISAGMVLNDGKYELFDANGKIGYINECSNKPYISIIKDGAGVGRIRLLPENTFCIGTMGLLYPVDTIDIKFLYYRLVQFDFRKYIVGGAIPHIYFKDYGVGEVYIPISSEQQKIADCLSAYDETIQIKKDKLEIWKEIKKGLLQQMFV